jgi:hypothetical protein
MVKIARSLLLCSLMVSVVAGCASLAPWLASVSRSTPSATAATLAPQPSLPGSSTAATPAPSASSAVVPEEIALLDSVHYGCIGSNPPSILWQPGRAEEGTDAPAAALRAVVSGTDPQIGLESVYLPDAGWLETDRTADRVLYLHTSGPPDFRNLDSVTVKRAADGTWGYGGLGSGGRLRCQQHGTNTGGVPWRLTDRPAPNDRTLQAEVQLQSCGHPTPEQIAPKSTAFYGNDAIDVLVVAPYINTGDVACPSWYPLTIMLDHPIADRAIFDAASLPLVQRWPK